MKLIKPIVATIIAAGLVSPVFAGYPTKHKAAKPAAKASRAASASWADRITMGADARFGYFDQSVDAGSDTSSLDMTDVDVVMDANVNSTTKAHMSFVYEGSDFNVEEAYATFNNVMGTPLSMTAGRKYIAFGHSADHRTPMVSLVQDLTQAEEDVVEFDYDNAGLHTAAYVYKDAITGGANNDTDAADDINKFGFEFAMASQFDGYKYNASFDWVNDVRTIADSHTSDAFNAIDGAKADKEAAYNLHFGLENGPFDMGLNYVKYAKAAWTNDAVAEVTDIDGNVTTPGVAAAKDANSKVSVTGVDLGYKLDTAGYKARFGVSYEDASDKSASVLKWKDRTAVSYMVDLSKHVTAGLEYATFTGAGDTADRDDVFASVKVSV